jgi:hypothetical protein
MRKTNRRRSASKLLLLAIVVIIISIFSFLIGTVVGFTTAMGSMSGCNTVDCASLGVDAESCEVCPSNGLMRISGEVS